MASDGNPVAIPAASPVHGSQAHIPVPSQERGGKILPPGGNRAAEPAAHAEAKASESPSIEALIAQLNKHFNNSGRPDQFRVALSSGDKVIQQINPANGAVVGEFPISEFPALARSIGMTRALVDSHA
jgi:hypothetical protein